MEKTFFEQGYIVVPELFNKEEVKEISTITNRLQKVAESLSQEQTGKVMYKGTQFVIDRGTNQTIIHRISWAGAAEPKLIKLARQEKVLSRVAQLLGSDEADNLINQLHLKVPNDEVKFDWHQDVKNRRSFDPKWKDVNGKGSFVQVITAIDPMTAENAPLKIIPELPKEGDLFLDTIEDPEVLEKRIGVFKAFSLSLSPGDTIFMHPHLIHGSDPNTSSHQKRRVFINGFAYPGANTGTYPGEGSAKKITLLAINF